MRRLLLVLSSFATAAALSSAAALSLPLSPGAGPAATASESGTAGWLDQVRSCSQDWQSQEALFDPGCLGRLWRAAFEAGSLADFNAAMSRQQDLTPTLASQCHEIGHETGRYAFAMARDAARLVTEASTRRAACDNGFVHGVLDGLGTSGPSEQDLLSALRACEQLDGDARLICVDGSGHAHWQAVHDTGAALEFCSRYASGRDRGTCFGGIAMQMFRDDTDGSRPAAARMEDAPSYMKALCRQVRDADPQITDACFTVAPRFLAFQAEQQTRAFTGAFGPQRKALAPATAGEVAALWRSAARGCDVFEPSSRGVRLCRERTAVEAAGAARVEALVDEICSLLEQDMQAPCRSARF